MSPTDRGSLHRSARGSSWKEAAGRTGFRVASEAFVIPISTGRPEAGLPPSDPPAGSPPRSAPGRRGRGQQVRLPRLDDRHAAQHLAHDDLDVLVVDRDALAAVDLLHLVDEVLLGAAHFEDPQHVLRVRGAEMSICPTSMCSPSATSRRERFETGYSWTSEPSSGVMSTLRDRSVSSISTRPAASEVGKRPWANGPREARPRGRPCVMSSAEATPRC